jgi:hypothetical protein
VCCHSILGKSENEKGTWHGNLINLRLLIKFNFTMIVGSLYNSVLMDDVCLNKLNSDYRGMIIMCLNG